MAFLVSPGVQVKEIDLTNVVPAVATSIGAIGGAFAKGPVSSVTNISSVVLKQPTHTLSISLQILIQGLSITSQYRTV